MGSGCVRRADGNTKRRMECSAASIGPKTGSYRSRLMELTNKRILVIGGAGLIGSHIVDLLTRTDVGEIIIYDNLFRGRVENLRDALQDPRVKFYPHGGDILHSDVLERAMEGIDGVFHLAALWLLQCHE